MRTTAFGVQMKDTFFKIACEDEEKDVKKSENADPLLEKFLKTRQILLSGEINEELAEKIITNSIIYI